MTETKILLDMLVKAKSTALDDYVRHPDDESHLSYQSLHELVAVFESMVANGEVILSFADKLLVPASLLDEWIYAIAQNRLNSDDNAYIAAEEAIKEQALKTLIPEELAEIESRPRIPRLYGLELDAEEAAVPFLEQPSEATLQEMNDWLKNVGKAAAWEARQQDNTSLIVQRQKYG